MRKLLLGLVLAAAVPVQAQIPQVNLNAQGPVIGISVNETVESRPDLALFDVGVSTTATTATEALAQNARKMENVIGRIRGAGVAARDIQTTGISLYPQHDHSERRPGAQGQPRIIGYTASNNVRVRYRRLDDVGSLIDSLVAAGANNINGPSFTIEDLDARMRQARDKALAAAEARAREYAAKVGARSVRLLSVTEGAHGRYYGESIVVTGARGRHGAAASSAAGLAGGAGRDLDRHVDVRPV